jgi:transcriptional regulator GlxA family with amidase domain
MRVVADVTCEDCGPLDLLVVPGGWGTRALRYHAPTIQFVRDQSCTAKVTSSVCTGAFILAEAGLLDGRRATTHWLSLDLLETDFGGKVIVDRSSHWVKDGDALYTSAGISAGIDMTLRIVADWFGEDVARRTARYMEYPFPESSERRIDLPAP